MESKQFLDYKLAKEYYEKNCDVTLQEKVKAAKIMWLTSEDINIFENGYHYKQINAHLEALMSSVGADDCRVDTSTTKEWDDVSCEVYVSKYVVLSEDELRAELEKSREQVEQSISYHDRKVAELKARLESLD